MLMQNKIYGKNNSKFTFCRYFVLPENLHSHNADLSRENRESMYSMNRHHWCFHEVLLQIVMSSCILTLELN